MTDGNHTCNQCGLQWFDTTLHCAGFCSPKCADAWYDAYPEEKASADRRTMRDVVHRFFVRQAIAKEEQLMTTDHTACTLRVAGLEERIEELERQLTVSLADTAAARAELAEFTAAVAREREQHCYDDDRTFAESPRARRAGQAQTTERIPRETMAEVIEGGRR